MSGILPEIIGLHVLVATNGDAARVILRRAMDGKQAADYPGGRAQLLADVHAYLSLRRASAESTSKADWILAAMGVVRSEM